ncbi:MAG: type II toxin-antitoxin system PemK/MazF family toxin [Planctomycetes bacterium]|nr:type II toxin-antitoxin system PemK/MazF family toxin [Planctomycetota bacterium]
MNRGDVRWYKFPRPDKKRPVVILTRDSALAYLGEVTVAPVTSTIRDIPSEVLLGPCDGMPRACAANLDHVQTVARGKIGNLITTLSEEKLEEFGGALLFALGFRTS